MATGIIIEEKVFAAVYSLIFLFFLLVTVFVIRKDQK